MDAAVTDKSGDRDGAFWGEVDAFPPMPGDRPCYRVIDQWTEADGRNYRPGLYHCTLRPSRDGKSFECHEEWISSPLRIEAVTYGEDGFGFGRLLQFTDSFGRSRTWAMPMELVKGRCDELQALLLAMGVELTPKNTDRHLKEFFLSPAPRRRILCVDQVGWHGQTYVLPDGAIGSEAASIVLQTAERIPNDYTVAGTLEGWRSSVAAMAVGNPLHMLALSASFSGPLLGFCGIDGSGLHFVNASSTGKSSLLDVACSVWGSRDFRKSWKASSAGQEGIAASRNDGLLALDEIGEALPREIGQVIYMLGNGRGKQRASRTGAAKKVVRWRCVSFSSGEFGLASLLEQAGQQLRAGQEVRMLEIFANRRFGVFDCLHDFGDGGEFAQGIRKAVETHYGHAGREYLHKLVMDLAGLPELFKACRRMPCFAVDGNEGQFGRVADQFAMFALAGEKATKYGLTGWKTGAAIAAAAEGFRLWSQSRRKGNSERYRIAEALENFISRYADSRFYDFDRRRELKEKDKELKNGVSGFVIHELCGGWRDIDGGIDAGGDRHYYLLGPALKEALAGFDRDQGLVALHEGGALVTDDSGEFVRKPKTIRVGGSIGRYYKISMSGLLKMLGD